MQKKQPDNKYYYKTAFSKCQENRGCVFELFFCKVGVTFLSGKWQFSGGSARGDFPGKKSPHTPKTPTNILYKLRRFIELYRVARAEHICYRVASKFVINIKQTI